MGGWVISPIFNRAVAGLTLTYSYLDPEVLYNDKWSEGSHKVIAHPINTTEDVHKTQTRKS